MAPPLARRLLLQAAVLCFGTFTASVHAYSPASLPALTLSGDLRARYEWDWDSQNASGVARADRDRARARARLSLGYKLSPEWSFGARVRTGSRFSQQSPHLTFHANDDITDDFEVQADRYFVQYKEGAFTAWGGRNTTPFWQQNEMWWDEDVTPTGLAVSYDAKLSSGTLTTTGAAFLLPDGMLHLNGSFAGLQEKFTRAIAPGQLTVAAGLYRFTEEEGARYLRNRNGARDYLLGVVSAQWTTPIEKNLPLALGVDLIKNFENYGTADVAPFAARQQDETNGYVFSAVLGQTKNPGDFQFGYWYAHIETLAVNASYSQDDWARFGAGPQSDVTDIKGHEFRATYVLTKSLNVQARLFFVDAITSVQDGKRCRVDLNWKF